MNINFSTINQYQDWLKKQNLDHSSIKRKLSSVNKFYNFLIKEGIVEKPPATSRQPPAARILDAGCWQLAASERFLWLKPITRYLFISIIIFLLLSTGYFIFENYVVKRETPVVQLATPISQPGSKTRYIAFQGKISKDGASIPSEVRVKFNLYSDETANARLWEENQLITPNADGSFSTLLGENTPISNDVFTDNYKVWLGVTIEDDQEMTPREQITTVGYAEKAKTIEGISPAHEDNQNKEATMGATINTIPVINPFGNLVLAQQSPRIWSTSGNFQLRGQALSFVTDTGTNGDIVLAPDGSGVINIVPTVGNQEGGTINATNSALTTGSLYTGRVENNNTSYKFIQFFGGSPATEKFYVDAGGNTWMSGNLTASNLYTEQYLYHTGDPNTFLNFENDSLKIAIGGKNFLQFDAGANTLIGNNTNDTVNFRWDGKTNDGMFYINATDETVGIGTTAPEFKLDVNGDGQFASHLRVGGQTRLGSYATNPTAVGKGALVYNSSNNTMYIWNGTSWVSLGGGTTAGFWQRNSNALAPLNIADDLLLGANATASALIKFTGTADNNSWINTGNVGIGTTDPAYLLEVDGTSRINGNFTIGDAAGDTVTSNAAAWTFANSSTIALNNAVNSLNFDGNTLTIDASNNRVGIGTTEPAATLSVGANLFTVAGATGDITTAGDLAINGDNITSDHDLTIDSSGGNISLGTSDNLQITAATNLIFGTTTSLGEFAAADDSGAYLVGAYDEFDYSNEHNVQGVLDDIDSTMASIIGGTVGMWTDAGTLTFLTSTADDLAIGSNSLVAPLSVVVSTNTIRMGTGSTANAVINMYSSEGDTGSLTYNTEDAFIFEDGNVGIGTTAPEAHLHESDTSTAADRGFLLSQHSTNTYAALMEFKKSRNTQASPAIVVDADYVGAFNFRPYDGDAYLHTAGFGARVNGTVADNSIPTDLFFWTSATDDTDPYLNNHARMVINSGGNVGIGTTDPQAKLEISDGTDSLRIAAAGDMTFVDANDGASITGPVGGALSVVAGASQALTLTGNAASTWSTSIGALVISGDDGLTLTAAYTAGVTINSTAAALDINADTVDLATQTTDITLNDAVDSLNFDSNTLSIDASNNRVGIGTTAPTNLLSLDGTAARTIWMERNTTAATAGQGLTLSSGGAIAGTNNLAGGDLTLKSGISTGTGTSAIHFYTATAGATGSTDRTPTEKMTILGSGSVGIGTTTPDAYLHVAESGGLRNAYLIHDIGPEQYVAYFDDGVSSTNGVVAILNTTGGFNSAFRVSANTQAWDSYTDVATFTDNTSSIHLIDGTYGINIEAGSIKLDNNQPLIGIKTGVTPTTIAKVDTNDLISIADGVFVVDPTSATEKVRIDSSGYVGIGASAPVSLFSVGATSQFQVNASGDVVKLKNLTYSWPSAYAASANGVLIDTDGAGTLTWSTIGATSITPNSLDYTEFKNTMTLDAALITNQTTYTWTQNFTGDTTNGYTYNANSLTSGNAYNISSNSTALTSGSLLALDWSPGSAKTATGDLLSLNIGANGDIGNLLNIKDNTSSLFSVSETTTTSNIPANFTAPGDVALAYDLNFTNQTSSYIKSNAPMYIEVGESFESNDLTLRTFNSGYINFETGTLNLSNQTVDVTLNNAVDSLNFDSNTLSIDASNNRIGIGTTSPGNKLSIVTPLTTGDDTIPALGVNGGKFGFLNGGGAGLYGLIGGVLSSGRAFMQVQRTDGTGTAYDMLLQPNGGNVGIGTTSSGARLQVSDEAGTPVSQSVLKIYRPNNLESPTTTKAALYIKDHSANYPLYIEDQAGVPYLVVEPAGNVGIGTTNPGDTLEVTGNILLSSGAARSIKIAYLMAGNNNNLNVEAGGAAAGNGGILYLAGGDGGGVGSPVGGNVYIYGGGGTTNGNVILAHNSFVARGNVGIGVTAPTNPLQVTGGGHNAALFLGGNTSTIDPLTTITGHHSILQIAEPTGQVGALIGVDSLYSTYIQARWITSSQAAKNLLLQPLGGLVGIGTTAPFAILNPTGATTTSTTAYGATTIAAVGQLDIHSTDAYTTQLGGKLTFSGVTGTGGVSIGVHGAIQGYKTNATINNAGGGMIFSTTNVDYGNLLEVMRITGASLGAGNVIGLVGIGTTAPRTNTTLDVNGGIGMGRLGTFGTYDSTQIQGIWSISPTYPISIASNNGGTAYGMVYDYDAYGVGISGFSHQIVFVGAGLRYASISMDTGKAYFAGNVGIGTTAPGNLLDVNGVARFTGGSSTNWASVNIGGTNSINAGGNIYSYNKICSQNASGGCDGAGGALINGGGNSFFTNSVGIGVTNPDAKLRVITSTAATSAVYGTNSAAGYGVTGENSVAGGVGVYGLGNSTTAYGVYANNPAAGSYGLYCNSGTTNGCGGNRNWFNASDARLKENIKTIPNALEKVLKLRGVDFNWKDNGMADMGFIAQEALPVIPEVVSYDPMNQYYGMRTAEITALLVEGMKEQQGQINLLSDLSLNLTSTGDIQIQGDTYDGLLEKDQIRQIGSIGLIKSTGEAITRVAAFAELAVGKLKAGLIDTTNLIAENAVIARAAIQSITINNASISELITHNIQSNKIISPLVETDNLVARVVQTEMIKPMADKDLIVQIQNSKYKIQNGQGKDLLAIDSTGNATFSGELNAQSIATNNLITNELISNNFTADTGHFRRLFADEIEGLDAKIASISGISAQQYSFDQATLENSSQNDQEASTSALLAQSGNWQLETGGYLDVASLDADSATIGEFLAVLGQATITNLTVTNGILVDNGLTITKNSIGIASIDCSNETMDQCNNVLSIQPSGVGKIDFLAGKFTIDDKGNAYLNGDLTITGQTITKDLAVAQTATVSGSLFANLLKPLPGNNLTINLDNNQQFAINNQQSGNIASIDASGSAKFAKLTIASAEATPSGTGFNQLIQPAVTTNASAGKATLAAKTLEITIKSPYVNNNSLIYITPTSDTQNQVLYVKSKAVGQFTVAINNSLPIDVNFNWWVIN